MKTYKQNAGLTLVELMVTVVAASVVVLTIILVLMAAFRSWRINNNFVDMRRNAAFATSLIIQDVRESTTNGLLAAENQLVLAANPPVRNTQVSYTKSGDSSLNSSSFGVIIPRGVQRFAAELNTQGDGVYVTLVLTNQYHIGITNRFFANTRN